MGTSPIVVAPREIVDVVDRASRVRGCSVSDAYRVAADVTYCEIHHGGGLAAWIELVDGEPGCLASAVRAARRLDRVALDAGVDASAVVRWVPPIPGVLVLRTLAALAARGIAATAAIDGADGASPVHELELVVAAPAAEPDGARARAADAMARGIAVDRGAWTRLEQEARGFLTPAADLDAADRHR